MKQMHILALKAVILFLITSSNTALADTTYNVPPDIKPVSEWANGFTADQVHNFRNTYKARNFVLGDDIGVGVELRHGLAPAHDRKGTFLDRFRKVSPKLGPKSVDVAAACQEDGDIGNVVARVEPFAGGFERDVDQRLIDLRHTRTVNAHDS